jgi:hypothetical protein
VEPQTLDELLEALPEDPWRRDNPFVGDFATTQEGILNPLGSREEKAAALLRWLASKGQPCLFGRMAAKKGWLSVCILTEADLARGDDHVREIIQVHRRIWKREALSGQKHGFIILVISQKLAFGEPGPTLQAFALRLCELYLSVTGLNKILHDSVDLRITRAGQTSYRRWKVGVNVFAAQADGRWWQDHRTPGGLAFSMNSVGHMARRLLEDALQARPALAERVAGLPPEKLESWALPLAMRTIATAARGPIPGTWLLGRSSGPQEDPEWERRRDAVLADLREYNEDLYRGRYHTDETTPAEYFDPGQARPDGLADHDLYFTYLHRKSDPDYESMGLGEEIAEALALHEELFPGPGTDGKKP